MNIDALFDGEVPLPNVSDKETIDELFSQACIHAMLERDWQSVYCLQQNKKWRIAGIAAGVCLLASLCLAAMVWTEKKSEVIPAEDLSLRGETLQQKEEENEVMNNVQKTLAAAALLGSVAITPSDAGIVSSARTTLQLQSGISVQQARTTLSPLHTHVFDSARTKLPNFKSTKPIGTIILLLGN